MIAAALNASSPPAVTARWSPLMNAASAAKRSARPIGPGSEFDARTAPAIEPRAASRKREGRSAVIGSTADVYFDAARLPMTATPSAAPSSRDASFVAEPAPARRGGTADMIDAVIGDIASAMPHVNGMIERRMYQYGVCGVSSRNISSPIATLAMPPATTRFAPNRALRRGVAGDTRIITGAIGRNRSAAPSGE